MTALLATGVAHLRRSRFTGATKVWALDAALAIAAIALFLLLVIQISPITTRLVLPWYVLALLFAVAEVLVVHLQFRREVHTFSLSEIPFVLGLFFATPVDFVIATVLGSAAALVIHRRQPLIKLAFNTAQFALGAVLGVSIFYAVRGPGVVIGAADWVATLLATVVMNLVGITTIAIAIALSEGRLEIRKLTQVFKFGLAVGVTNTIVVLTAVTFLWKEPENLWLLILPAAVLYLAYRAYMSEREKHESLEFLYESTTILQRTPEIDQAIVELIAHARRMFRAEVAELTLVPNGDAREALRTSLGPDDRSDVMVPVDPAELGPTWASIVADGHAMLVARSMPGDETPDVTRTFRLKDAIVAPLRGDRGVLGMFVVGDRMSDVGTFDDEDLRLLETLARHAGIALENGRLGESLTQLTELKEQLKYQAFHDSLTGLGNRALFLERVATALARRTPGPSGPIVLFVDLDDFKTVNDSLGHGAGDALLVAVSERLRSCLRPGDLAARLGGDEFAILLEGGELTHALVVGERIIAALHLPFLIEDNEVVVRASVGIATSELSSDAPDELLRDADVAMYTAKAQGKGRVAVFEPAMQEAVMARHALTGKLQRAVAREQFDVRYQPLVDLQTGDVVGAEALVRWVQPNGRIVGPAEFISLAEETGLILPLGRWVMETACRQAAAWQATSPERLFHLAVNLSARQVQQPGFLEEVAEVLALTGIEPGTLTLEITETVMMQDTQATIAKLNGLKALGVRLAIDDFGTGYSSLSYLRRFPVDILKMAKPFVETAAPGDQQSVFASAIIALGHSLGLEVVAEGIERVEQLGLLRELGCDLGQGFYFAEPLDTLQMTALLSRRERALRAVPVQADAGRSYVLQPMSRAASSR